MIMDKASYVGKNLKYPAYTDLNGRIVRPRYYIIKEANYSKLIGKNPNDLMLYIAKVA
jgi:hypothetical protein